MIGHNISHYRVTKELGQGDVGVVYNAEDTKPEPCLKKHGQNNHLKALDRRGFLKLGEPW